jgi:hypothetical protein
VVVVSEETGGISVVMGGEMMPGLDAPTLRVVLRDIMAGERRDLSPAGVAETPFELADVGPGSADASRTAT